MRSLGVSLLKIMQSRGYITALGATVTSVPSVLTRKSLVAQWFKGTDPTSIRFAGLLSSPMEITRPFSAASLANRILPCTLFIAIPAVVRLVSDMVVVKTVSTSNRINSMANPLDARPWRGVLRFRNTLTSDFRAEEWTDWEDLPRSRLIVE